MWKLKLIQFFLSTVIFLTCCTSSKQSQYSEHHKSDAGFTWQRSDSSLALVKGSDIIWRLNFNKAQDKPYFHPLRVNGTDLTLERPADHPWHWGLWFSWKYINKINYWEDAPARGHSQGRSYIKNVKTELHNDHSATINIEIEYAPEGEKPILYEHRTLKISAPDRNSGYIIDWRLKFHAKDSALVFDRTPPAKYGGPGENWGGYGGLSYRAAQTVSQPVFRSSNGWTTKNNLTGEAGDANWMDMTAVVSVTPDKLAGITIFDHSRNPRTPSPWYIWFSEGQNTFFTPALLYNKPLEIKANEEFILNYRTYVHAGRPSEADLENMFKQFNSGK
jgi:hypothetical protein